MLSWYALCLQDRNTSATTFGGHLLRIAAEHAASVAAHHAHGAPCQLLQLRDVAFASPVNLGDVMFLDGSVSLVQHAHVPGQLDDEQPNKALSAPAVHRPSDRSASILHVLVHVFKQALATSICAQGMSRVEQKPSSGSGVRTLALSLHALFLMPAFGHVPLVVPCSQAEQAAFLHCLRATNAP